MAVAGQKRYHGRWLIVLAVVGLLLIFGIFRMLFNAPGRAEPVIEEHPQQTVR